MQKKPLPKAVLQLLFFLLVGVAFFVMWGKAFHPDSRTKKNADNNAVEQVGPLYSLEPVVVELAGRYLSVTKVEEDKRPYIGTRKRYLKIALNLELKDEKTIQELEKNLPQVKKAVSEIASSKTVNNIESVEGKTAFRVEIMGKLNSIFQEDLITNVFFAEFIIQ